MPHDEPLAGPISEESLAADEELRAATQKQDEELQEFAKQFLLTVVRLRGVHVEREAFLTQELRRLGLPNATIERAVETNPVQAGVMIDQLDSLAEDSISFETKKSAALSFAAGVPGGLALFATIPGDLTQYYVHAFRVMQKLAYLYGWTDFLKDMKDADDETVGLLASFLGVMMGVGGASATMTKFAQQVAQPAIQRQIAQKALTKTIWYSPIKSTLKLIGIKLTKDTFAKSVAKAVPLAGGVISGGMTLISLGDQSRRLKAHLRELPPPGVDASEYLAALTVLDAEVQSTDPTVLDQARASAQQAASGMASGAKGAAELITGGAQQAAAGAASALEGAAGALRRFGFGQTDKPKGEDSAASPLKSPEQLESDTASDSDWV